MGSFLMLIGLGWAVIGVSNFFSMATNTPAVSSTVMGFSLLFQMMIFVFPGLILAGIGYGIRNKKTKKGTAEPIEKTKVCPYCAETIKAEAIICRYCNKDQTADVHP